MLSINASHTVKSLGSHVFFPSFNNYALCVDLLTKIPVKHLICDYNVKKCELFGYYVGLLILLQVTIFI